MAALNRQTIELWITEIDAQITRLQARKRALQEALTMMRQADGCSPSADKHPRDRCGRLAPGYLADLIVDALRRVGPDDYATPVQIHRLLDGATDLYAVRAALTRLTRQGRVRRVDRGLYQITEEELHGGPS